MLAELLGKKQGRIFSHLRFPLGQGYEREGAFPVKALILILLWGARSELALNKNKLGFLLATMNECFLIEQKEFVFAVIEEAALGLLLGTRKRKERS